MRSTNLFAIISALLFFLLFFNTVFAAKIVGKDENRNIVTLDQSFKKGTRLIVFVGNQKIGLIESIGGNQAKIIYGKKDVDIGAHVKIKPPPASTVRTTYSTLPFLNIQANPEYLTLIGSSIGDPSSSTYRIKLKIDKTSSGHAKFNRGVHFGYIKFGDCFGAVDVGIDIAIGIEILPEILELYFSGGSALVLSFSKLNWARPNGNYDDAIRRNSGTANPSPSASFEGGVGIDFRVSHQTSVFFYVNYLKIFVYWEDSEKPDNTESNYSIEPQWLEYTANEIGGPVLEAGLRFNIFSGFFKW